MPFDASAKLDCEGSPNHVPRADVVPIVFDWLPIKEALDVLQQVLIRAGGQIDELLILVVGDRGHRHNLNRLTQVKIVVARCLSQSYSVTEAILGVGHQGFHHESRVRVPLGVEMNDCEAIQGQEGFQIVWRYDVDYGILRCASSSASFEL